MKGDPGASGVMVLACFNWGWVEIEGCLFHSQLWVNYGPDSPARGKG